MAESVLKLRRLEPIHLDGRPEYPSKIESMQLSRVDHAHGYGALHLETIIHRSTVMVKIRLQMKAYLEGIGEVRADGEEFRWYLKLRCANCGEETKWIYVTQMEKVPVKGGRGEVSLLFKCKMCSRENSLDIMADYVSPYKACDSGNFKTIVAFECRGVEPVAFDPRGGFSADGENSGSKFADISLANKEGWFDYDEEAQREVTITDVEFRFNILK